MTSDKHKKLLPLSKLFPNMVTLLGLCAGLTSIRLAFNERWEMAVMFIVIAAFIDGMDGRLARMLGAQSSFGAHLDSIADFFNFGVAPAFILYIWSLQYIPIKGLGWGLTMCFSICMALRLARFNAAEEAEGELDEKQSQIKNTYFCGIPAPCSAGLVLIPMMLSFEFSDHAIYQYVTNSYLIALYLAVIALLTISRIPTFSSKKHSFRRENASIILFVAGIFIIGIIIKPWITLPLMGLFYCLTIIFSILSYQRNK